MCSHAGKEQVLTSCTRPSSSAATPDGPALPAYLLERGKPADDAVTEEESSGEDSSSGDSDDDGKDDRVTSTVDRKGSCQRGRSWGRDRAARSVASTGGGAAHTVSGV